MQVSITAPVRAALTKLNYTADEITSIDPSFVAVVIQRQTQRPAGGMPAAWKRKGGAPLEEKPVQKPNEPCACGSGKKYKKCCRLAASNAKAMVAS